MAGGASLCMIYRNLKRISKAPLETSLKICVLQIQKSVYVTPYPCEDQVIYLREYFDIGDEVLMFRADKIENEEIYKDYFGI